MDNLTSSYDYYLPPSLIASYPLKKRDEAKLLVYDRKKDRVIHTIFKNILDFVGDKRFIFNDTKVIKARIFGRKESGGRVELLLNRVVEDGFLVYIRGKVKVGSRLIFDDGLEAVVEEVYSDGSRRVKFFKDKELDFGDLILILDKIGHIPLPPYIKREAKEIDEREYQTVFAKKDGAVAAPTASLHFTDELLKKIKKRSFITLHVGAGTFKGVESEDIRDHKMHSEYFEIPEDVARVIESDEEIVAVGTTVARSIEYFVRSGKLKGECDLFLNPFNPPKRVNHLITNFHLPKSTLIMLVASFIGREKTLSLYKEAINKGYRFYSYGDAMLII